MNNQSSDTDSIHSALLDLMSTHKIDQVVLDCVTLVQDEVKKKRGLTGTMIKGGMKVIERIRPNILSDLFYSLLPSFVEALKPIYERYQSKEHASSSFAEFMNTHASEVANLLLSVTDKRAKVSKLSALGKIYEKLRPLALEQIKSAIPALAQLLNKHGVQ